MDATQTQIDKCLERRDNLYAASEIRRRNAPLIRQIRSLCGLHDAAEQARIAITSAQLRELGDMTSRLINYARGYTALCDRLGGSLERAIRGYRQVLDTFVANRELRAVSISSRHLGDLYARTGELALAENHLQHAVNAASQAEQRDVQYLAIASQASVMIDRDQLDKARGFTERASRYARQMGLYRLEADALLVDAKLKTRRGENGAAAEAAANAVSICLKNGLRLRKVSSLVKYGAVQFARGESELGRGVLEEAKREAEKLGYQIQAARAADILATV